MGTWQMFATLIAGAALFGVLRWLGRVPSGAGNAFAALLALNLAGIVGLCWFMVEILTHDGVMVIELSLCAGLIVALTAITGGGFVLQRRGKSNAANALLAVGAVPVLLVFGLPFYLEANPIDLR